MKINKVVMVAGGMALAGVTANVHATTVTSSTNFKPSLTITATCFVSVGNVAFPNTSVSAAGTTVTSVVGTVFVGNCSGGNYYLAADGGGHYTGGVRHLQLISGTNQIVYSLDLSGSGTQIDWGSCKNNPCNQKVAVPVATDVSRQQALHKGGASAGDVYTITAHATIPSVGTIAAGTYIDSVVVAIEY
jgi:spore coat protein U-like protein